MFKSPLIPEYTVLDPYPTKNLVDPKASVNLPISPKLPIKWYIPQFPSNFPTTWEKSQFGPRTHHVQHPLQRQQSHCRDVLRQNDAWIFAGCAGRGAVLNSKGGIEWIMNYSKLSKPYKTKGFIETYTILYPTRIYQIYSDMPNNHDGKKKWFVTRVCKRRNYHELRFS